MGERFDVFKDASGEWRWTYHASNGKRLAMTSEGYVRREDCERAMTIVREGAASAEVRYLPERGA